MKNFDSNTAIPHIGKIIRDIVIEKAISEEEIKETLDFSESMLDNIYQSRSVDFETLVNFSNLLKTNLLLYYGNHPLVKNFFDSHFAEQARQIEQKNETIAQQNAIITAHKKVISIYEANDIIQKWTKPE